MVLSPSPYHDAFPYRSSHSLYLPTSFVFISACIEGCWGRARELGYHCNTYARARAAPSIPIGPQNQFSLSAAATQQVQQYFCFPPFCFLFFFVIQRVFFSFYCALIENPLEFLQSRSEEGRQMQWDSSPSSPTPTTPCGPSESVTYYHSRFLFRPVHTCCVDMKSVSYFRMQIYLRNFVYVDITSYSDVICVNMYVVPCLEIFPISLQFL